MDNGGYGFEDITPRGPEYTEELVTGIRKITWVLARWYRRDPLEIYTDLWTILWLKEGKHPDFVKSRSNTPSGVSYLVVSAKHGYMNYQRSHKQYIGRTERWQRKDPLYDEGFTDAVDARLTVEALQVIDDPKGEEIFNLLKEDIEKYRGRLQTYVNISYVKLGREINQYRSVTERRWERVCRKQLRPQLEGATQYNPHKECFEYAC